MDVRHGDLMDRIYRHQRHIYDLTRKYYLLGRDELIAALTPPGQGSVLEIGCGTGRNLLAVRRRYPKAHLYGLDISEEMLVTARQNSLGRNIAYAKADAADFDPMELFGEASFDRIFISYALSMIPSWQAVLASAAKMLAPGGELHVVDFGQQEKLPRAFRTALRAWLAKFHVTPRAHLREVVEQLARQSGAKVEFAVLRGGYAWRLVLRRATIEERSAA
ncbi:class I SAM-dependent methyltransferase [Taklimakanibacter lacteus]|uniref:class I SAM-dependent methyltransferase n=1 Tax=Taklimakanibacter lacteus TaxID=2268456 RepID=UPI000E6701CC